MPWKMEHALTLTFFYKILLQTKWLYFNKYCLKIYSWFYRSTWDENCLNCCNRLPLFFRVMAHKIDNFVPLLKIRHCFWVILNSILWIGTNKCDIWNPHKKNFQLICNIVALSETFFQSVIFGWVPWKSVTSSLNFQNWNVYFSVLCKESTILSGSDIVVA